MSYLPKNVIAVSPERDDTGRRVVINSIGGPSWPDNRSGKEVIANYDRIVAKHTKTDKWARALGDLPINKVVKTVIPNQDSVWGTVVWGPYKLFYHANAKKKDKNGEYIERKGQFVMEKQKFITEPYWNVLLDGYNREMMFIEKELTFI